MEVGKQEKHFVLVHGACHGAWCWYKLKPRLEAAGHRATAIELSASGIDTKKLDEVRTLYDYTMPLLEVMASISPKDKVILVGHSLGGMNIAIAMDKYPEKISVGVFLTAFMPDSVHGPSYVLDQFVERMATESWLDTEFAPYGSPDRPLTSMVFGPKFVSSKLYHLSPVQDLALATMLVRPSSLFIEDLSKAKRFSDEGYGSVKRVYVVCGKDLGIPEEFQRWMIESGGGTEVKEIKNADHMAMLSRPRQLCQCLLEIANAYD